MENFRNYPRVGSTWQVSLGPDIPRTKMRVISSGHGVVVVQQLGGKYAVAIDILRWQDGPYLPEKAE